MAGQFSINAEPDQLDRASAGYTELAEHLKTRATQVTSTPGEISEQQWSGKARQAITTEMTALGGQMTRFAPMFTEAAQALKTLATTVRTAKTTTIPGLNSRWEGAQNTYNDAVAKANTAYTQDLGGIAKDDDYGPQLKKTLRVDAQETRNAAHSAAFQARQSEEAKLTGEFNALVTELENAFKTCASTLAGKTLVQVPDSTVSDFVGHGGNGSTMSWSTPDGRGFPPPFGTRNELGKSLTLYDDLRAFEDGQRAAELGNKIKDPEHQPTKAELDELNGLLGTNKDDKVFSTEFMTGVGPRGLLELNGRIATLQGDNKFAQSPDSKLWDEELAKTVGALQKNLGFTLATATQDVGGENQLGWQWVMDLEKAGKEKFTIGFNSQNPEGMTENEVYGYQLLAPLLRHGTYGADFIASVGGDMVDFEMDQKGDAKDKSGVWGDMLYGHTRLNWSDGWGTFANSGNDPVSSLMVALGKSPEGSLQFFTSVTTFDGSKDGGRNPRLDYLLTDREWPYDLTGAPDDKDLNSKEYYDYEPKGLDLLGGALEAATSNTDDQRAADLVENIVWEITHDEQATGRDNGDSGSDQTKKFSEIDLIPPELRDSMGNIMATWIPSVHGAFDSSGTEIGVGKDGVDVDPYTPGVQTVGIEFDDASKLRLFLADVGKDEAAYNRVQNAEVVYLGMAYDTLLANGVNEDSLRSLGGPTQAAGDVFGTLDFGAVAAGRNEAATSDTQANDQLKAQFAVGGVLVDTLGAAVDGPTKVAGTGGASVINKVLDAWHESLKHNSVGDVNAATGLKLGDSEAMTRSLTSVFIAANMDPAQYPGALKDQPFESWAYDEDKYKIWLGYLNNSDPEGQLGRDAGATVDGSATSYRSGYTIAKEQLQPFEDLK
jgi:hypothetical protein